MTGRSKGFKFTVVRAPSSRHFQRFLCRTEKKERKDKNKERKSYGKNPPPHFLLFENPKRLKKEKKKRSSNRFGSVIQYLEDGPAGNYIILFFCSKKKQKSAVWGMKEAKVFGDKLLLMDINGLLAQGKLYNMASALWVNLEKVGGWIGRMMIAWLGILYGTESGIRPSLATFHRSSFFFFFSFSLSQYNVGAAGIVLLVFRTDNWTEILLKNNKYYDPYTIVCSVWERRWKPNSVNPLPNKEQNKRKTKTKYPGHKNRRRNSTEYNWFE